MPTIDIVYKQREMKMTQEFIGAICRSEDWDIKQIKFEQTPSGEGWECDLYFGEENDLSCDVEIQHYDIAALTEEDKSLFTSIWDDLQKYKGIINIIFYETSDDFLHHLYKVLYQIDVNFETKEWMEEYLFNFPTEKEFLVRYGTHKGFGCFPVITLLPLSIFAFIKFNLS